MGNVWVADYLKTDRMNMANFTIEGRLHRNGSMVTTCVA